MYPETENPRLCEMITGNIVQCQGIRLVVINPAQGLVVPLVDPTIKFLSPSSPVTHFGEAHGTHISWKPFSGNPPLTPEFEAFVKNTPIPGRA